MASHATKTSLQHKISRERFPDLTDLDSLSFPDFSEFQGNTPRISYAAYGMLNHM